MVKLLCPFLHEANRISLVLSERKRYGKGRKMRDNKKRQQRAGEYHFISLLLCISLRLMDIIFLFLAQQSSSARMNGKTGK